MRLSSELHLRPLTCLRQIINAVQAAERGSGLEVPPPDQLPAGPLGQYGQYVALMEVRGGCCWMNCNTYSSGTPAVERPPAPTHQHDVVLPGAVAGTMPTVEGKEPALLASAPPPCRRTAGRVTLSSGPRSKKW